MPKRYHLLERVMLVVVAVAGFVGAPAWFIFLAAGGLTIEDWAKLWPLRSPALVLSAKMITYFVTGVVANVFYAAVSYGVGAVARSLV